MSKQARGYWLLWVITIVALGVLVSFMIVAWAASPHLTEMQFFLLNWRLYVLVLELLVAAWWCSRRLIEIGKRERDEENH